MMDQAVVGSIYTVIVFFAFIGACLWAFSSRNKKDFDEAANLVFDDEDKKSLNKENQES